MDFYFAPLEGITGYIYRNAWHQSFGGADKYFTPFIAPNENRGLGPKERKDILPENNPGICLIPQILTNKASHFVRAARELEEIGYKEINLNLGCPSGTVVAKNRGAGFLACKEELNRFLEEIFRDTAIAISIKTRIGKDVPQEFDALLRIYNQYPLKELIIHPRVRADYYKNKPNLDIFEEAVGMAEAPLCYNGDIFDPQSYHQICRRFPTIGAVMIGRGLLSDPGLLNEIRNGSRVSIEQIKSFHGLIYQAYKEVMPGDKVVLFKMKELWVYMHLIFSESERYLKKIKKANRLCDYEEAVRCLLEEQGILPYMNRKKPGTM